MSDKWDGDERRADYQDDQDNGLAEENGAVVKRVTLTTIYRRVKAIERNQHKICTQLDELSPKVEAVNGHKQMLEDHVEFCLAHRSAMQKDVSNQDSYESGRKDAEMDAEKNAEARLRRSMYFWAKVLLPALALLLAILAWLFEVIPF